MHSHRSVLLIAALCSGLLNVAPAIATDIPLAFGSLPSAQGWTFTTGGSSLATEGTTFSLSGGVLTLDTMSYGFTGAGTAAYYARFGAVNNFEPIVIRMRGRVVQFEGDFTNAFVGGGFTFGFSQGATQWAMGITPTQIRNVNGVILSSAYDNTLFHDYRLEWNPPSSVRYYVDNTLISSTSGGISFAQNRLYFGDGTGASNSRSEIKQYEFLQGAATSTHGNSWGRIKKLYR
ncbi:MAG: hypothetical protein ABIU54_12355 [Candidatus Eisenbacteria bacterium]